MYLQIRLINPEPIKQIRTGIYVRRDGGNKELSVEEAILEYGPNKVKTFTDETDLVVERDIIDSVKEMCEHVNINGTNLWEVLINAPNLFDNALAFGKFLMDANAMMIEKRDMLEIYGNTFGSWLALNNYIKALLHGCIDYPNAKVHVEFV